MCDAETQGKRCVAEGNHPIHVAGYGGDRVTWKNEFFVSRPRPMSDRRLLEIKQQILDNPVL